MKRKISKRFELNRKEAELLRIKARQTGLSEGEYLRELISNSQPVEAPPHQFYFRTYLLTLDGVAAVPEGYCCAGSALLFPFYPVVNSGCPYGVGLLRKILAVDIEAGVGCRVLALTGENSGEVFLH